MEMHCSVRQQRRLAHLMLDDESSHEPPPEHPDVPATSRVSSRSPAQVSHRSPARVSSRSPAPFSRVSRMLIGSSSRVSTRTVHADEQQPVSGHASYLGSQLSSFLLAVRHANCAC
eukprot:5377632-Prymnesium_polylepis.2